MGTVSTQKLGNNDHDLGGANHSYKDQDADRGGIDKAQVRDKAQQLKGEIDDALATVKKNWLPILLSGVGVLALGGGLTGILTYRARQKNRLLRKLLKLF